MRRQIGVIAAVLGAVVIGSAIRAQGPPQGDRPEWAYGIAPAGATAPPADHPTGLLRVPGSSRTFTLEQIEDGFGPADWLLASMEKRVNLDGSRRPVEGRRACVTRRGAFSDPVRLRGGDSCRR